MKKYLGPIIFLLIIIATALFLTSVNSGVLTLDILERVSGVTIDYQDIKGNVLSGFRIGRYCVRLSETDSVYGTRADIRYRFNPFMLRLPNLFEINLIEPTITVEEKKNGTGGGFWGLPNLRLGLRVNLKNGQVIYKNRNLYKIEGISGIVFIDFAGSRTRVATMNLSLRSEKHSVYIRTLNLHAEVDDEGIRLNSFKLTGTGLVLQGSGGYSFEPRSAAFDFEKAHLDLGKFGMHQGKIDFTGRITYARDNIMPQIRGSVTDFRPFDKFGFETNAAADTIWVNIFDGEILGGGLFAQLRVTQLRDIEFAMNFRNLNVGELIGVELPVMVNGYLAYTDKKFRGFVNSPRELGFGLDSLFFFGSFVESDLYVDSLFVSEGKRTLRANGMITPEIDFYIAFTDFDLNRFESYFPIGGRLNGSFHLAGEPRDLYGVRFTSDIMASDFSLLDLSVDELVISSVSFQKDMQERNLSIALGGLHYKGLELERTIFSVTDTMFTFVASDSADSVQIDGILRDELRGTISSLIVNYNRVLTRNVKPIGFDIMNRMIGDVSLSLANGNLEFSRVPLGLALSNIDLHEIGRLLGLREELHGNLNVRVENDSIAINVRGVDFLGLKNGELVFSGRYVNESIFVDSIHIHDDNGQECTASGVLSFEQSELTARFQNVGVWVLAFLENILGNPTGLMTGEITFRGDIEQFELGGGGKIHDGSFSVDIIASQFDSVNTDVIFEGNRILFASGKGLISPKNGRSLSSQWVDGGGVVKLEPRFGVDNLKFDFSFVDAPVQFPPFAYGVGSGNFSLNMRDRLMHYNGNITLSEGIVPLEFGMKISEDQQTGDDDWRMNIRVKGERDIWLRNREADMEFGGELFVVKETGPVYLTGVMETDRGNFYWANHVLSITQGKVTFIPDDEIDPDIDFWAELDTREGIRIILHLFGPISEPVFEFFTDPPGQYTEQDIVTYLNLNITWQELEQMKRGEYMSGLSRGLVSWLEGDVSRRIRQYTGLDYFRIETPFFEPDERTKLTVGKFISRNLFVTYTYDITTFSNEFNVEYVVDDNNKISVERDETGEYRLQYNYRIRF